MASLIRAFLTVAATFVCTLASAQDEPIKLDVDFASFAYGENTSLLEIYLAVGSGTLEYESDSAGLSARLPIHLRLDHSTVTTLLESSPEPDWTDTLLLRFSLSDSTLIAEGQHFLHQIRAAVTPGEYVLTIAVPPSDAAPGGQSVKRDVLIPDYTDASQPAVSDLELATSISRAVDRDDEFYKNGLSIKPNPYLLFGSNLSHVFFYFETYNTGTAGDSTYTAYTFISQSSLKQPLGDLSSRTERAVRSPDAIVGGFDISGLPSGSYLLNVVLLDDENRSLAEQSRRFFVYNPDVEAETVGPGSNLAYETSFYASMSEEELDQQIQYARIIATNREDDRLKSAKNADAKREALVDFWAKRDPDPRTPINEVREEYFTRVQYARERYSNTHSEGWQTDRGRVYLKYGVPAHVNPHHYERGMAPYEIWEYDNIPGEGRAMFVFADVSGFSEFELIHSDVTGERQSVNWRAELRQ